MTVALAVALLLALPVDPPAEPARPLEINTALMHSTVHLQGPGGLPGTIATGTGVIVGRPCGNGNSSASYVLVTAAHVLEGIGGNELRILARTKEPSGNWRKVMHLVPLRSKVGPLWVKHPSADAAAMYVTMPDGSVPQLLSADVFATDKMLHDFEVHVGDEVLALGFPLGAESSESGFPILRSGRIASYPITPQEAVRTFLVDMAAFPGNSGGPVYFWDRNRTYGNVMHAGEEVRFLMGIVVATVSSKAAPNTSLVITQVLHANFVTQAIARLPPPKCEP